MCSGALDALVQASSNAAIFVHSKRLGLVSIESLLLVGPDVLHKRC